MSRQLEQEQIEARQSVSIEKLVYGGDGLARLDGQVTLIPYVLPGELVRIQTERVNSGLLRGKEPEVIESSASRVIPKCEYFGNCGGCHYQHVEYSFQVEQKKAILTETLQRQGGIKYEGEIRALTGEPWYYRNRIQLHFADRAMGFRKAGSHEICPISHCEISSPTLNEVISHFQQAVKQDAWPTFLRSLEVFTNESEVQLNVLDSTRPIAARFFEWCATFLPKLAAGPIAYEALGVRFKLSGGSFFQVNRFLIDPLIQEVIGDSTGRTAVDLYSGVGLFSLPLARRFENVSAVERGSSAVRDLEFNAQENDLPISAHKATAEEFLASLTEAPDLLIADPPRTGLGKQSTQEILRVRPSEIVIVSCDPTTLARDLRTLLPAYNLKQLTMVDLFPQTYHIETVARLQRQ